jgi:hypothetical protein
MFLVDDLVKRVIDYFYDKYVEGKRTQAEAVAHARKAMRKLAASLGEVVGYLEDGMHRLQKSVRDRRSFARDLGRLVSQEQLQKNCHESGVCEDLRNAQDELNQLPEAKRPGPVSQLITEIDGYEREFVRAVREFLSVARGFDLTAAQALDDIDAKQALRTLQARVRGLKRTQNEIERLADALRRKSVAQRSGR